MPKRGTWADRQQAVVSGASGNLTVVASGQGQPSEISRDPVSRIYRQLRPRLTVWHGVAYAAVLLTAGIVALALGHFDIGLAAVLLSAPSVLLGLKAWLDSGRAGPLDRDRVTNMGEREPNRDSRARR